MWTPEPGVSVWWRRRTGCSLLACGDSRATTDLVIDEDEDDVWLAVLLVGNLSVTPVGLGLLSRQQVQAEEEAP